MQSILLQIVIKFIIPANGIYKLFTLVLKSIIKTINILAYIQDIGSSVTNVLQ